MSTNLDGSPDLDGDPFTYPDNPVCFCEGTSLKSESGWKSVSEFQKGDLVTLASGELTSVLWIGILRVSVTFGLEERMLPVRILQGALGDNVPSEDLTISNDHAFLIDDILATASSLVNGSSIFRVPLSEYPDGRITYYHIETDKHEIILANNAPAETFIDNVSRSAFDNFQEYLDLYGEEREMDELPIPRAMSPRQLPKKIKARLAARAEALGYDKKAAA